AFLSLLAPQVLVLALPTLLVNLLSTDGFMHELEGFHYGVTLAPIVVVSAAYGAGWLLRRFPKISMLPLLLSVIVLLATFVYHRGEGYTPLASDFPGSWPAVTNHHLIGKEMAKSIPRDASLAALPYTNPHASQREKLYMIDRLENGALAPISGADLVWLDVMNSWPLHPNDLKAGVDNLLSGGYRIDLAADGWLLLERGSDERELDDAFFEFARATQPDPQYPMQLEFLLDGVPVLEALGFDLDQIPSRSDPQAVVSTLHFYWRALATLPPDLRLYPFYGDDETGVVLEDTGERPMITTVWYPPDRWQAGEIVKTSMLPWNVGPDFSVGVGVVQGQNWSVESQRLPIRVASSEQIVRLLEGDTWARLLHVEDGEAVPERRVYDLPSPQHPIGADFDGKIGLLGYDLERTKNDGLQLTLYWQAQQVLDTSYTVFAQLLGPTGEVRSQVDAVPKDGSYPTLWWLPGEIVADPSVFALPPDALADENLRLIVGLYDPATGQRLPVRDTDRDYVELSLQEP
ncbi:DUF2079 domain-containing protein, partial [Chloroflexota bacterium]